MNAPKFSSALGRFQLRWRAGLFAAGVLQALVCLGIVSVLFGTLDFFAGFSDAVRRVLGAVLGSILAAGGIWALWKTVTFMRRDAAVAADRALASPRREVLSALELAGSAASGGGLLGPWLRERAVDQAARQMNALPTARSVPAGEISRAGKAVLLLAALLAVCALLLPRATSTISRRLLQPGADIPPYSALVFTLTPQPAEVLYGGEILISGEIRGGKISAPVRALTRNPETRVVEESPAYQENPTRFSTKLEKVAAPVEVAFAVGRARSPWLPVAVRMQPKVQDVLLTVEPPAYTGMPRREFAIGAQDLAALPGSRVTAWMTSNRPLASGTLRLTPSVPNSPAQEIAAVRDETHRVRFTWIARGAARLAFEVRDVVGTASEPLTLEQKLIPDERPEVALRQPAGDVLATPDSELPLEATAADDLGLTRVSFVRELRGYRERSLPQAVQPGNRRHEITGSLKLAAFGVTPGQVIELTLEAGDTNPNLLGVSVSEPARVHIIEREQYAEMLRNQTTLEDFSERYAALNEAMDEARKSLEELEKAAHSGDESKAEEARSKAAAAHQKAAQLFGQIAKDFPIFDLDAALAQSSADAMKRLFENGQELEELAGQPAGELKDAVPQLKERLGEARKEMAEEMEKGERAIAAGKVFEQAGVFGELLEEQRDLAKDFNRLTEQLRRGEMQAGQGLRDLARRQSEVAEGVRQLEKNLGDALGALPEEFAGMRKEGAEFLQALGELKIPPTMDEGAKAAESADSKTAGDRAGEALAKLEALLRKKNGFCAMCRGEGEQPFPWPEDLSETLRQLMQALIPKPGGGGGEKPGAGTGGGQGFGGRSASGFWMRGKMPQLPIYGPSRSRFARNNAGPQAGGKGEGGAGSGRGADDVDVKTNQLTTASKRAPAGETLALETVPEAYRAAVKRYFSPVEQTSKP